MLYFYGFKFDASSFKRLILHKPDFITYTIMKVSKVFGFVLCLHLGAVVVLMIQPGCKTTQPPTKTFSQVKTLSAPSNQLEDSIVETDAGLDAAFNSGMQVERSSPRRPVSEFSEFESLTALQPIISSTVTAEASAAIQSYTVKSGDSLWGISKAYSVSIDQLLQLNGLKKTATLKIGQQINIPVTAAIPEVKSTAVAADSQIASQQYRVVRGDSLSKIAKKFKTTVASLKSANNKASDLIQLGERLLIPSSVEVSALSQPSSKPVLANSARTHVVQSGEYPGTIARKYGMTSNQLLSINGITDARTLQVGQVLKLGQSASVQPQVTDTVATSVQSSPSGSTSSPVSVVADYVPGPVEIRVVEADPLVEAEAAAFEAEIEQVEVERLFEGALEIPITRIKQ